MTGRRLIAAAALLALVPRHAAPDDHEQVAVKLLSATVTVRILPPKPAATGLKSDVDASGTTARLADERPTRGVTVCSGVSVAPGVLCTFAHAPAERLPLDRRYRITMADGEQATAVLSVADHYSGLSLLDITRRDLPVLEPADGSPAVGSAALTAAASGIERPVVSLGIVSGFDRSLGGTGLPPLLQCDVRTTDASSGAAVVDRDGKLLGIVAATSEATQGWSFAVPARHVRRLLTAREPQKLVVLERRRPVVGLTMGAGAKEGTVVVERIEAGGPAEKAGIRKGDLILEADGRKIRSAYQAVDLILNRQPGETINFFVQQDASRKAVDVTLASGEPIRSTGPASGGPRVGPQVNVRMVRPDQLEVGFLPSARELGTGGLSAPRRSPGDEVSMLRAQLAAFEKVIARLQAELDRRAELQAQTDETLESLRKQMSELRQKLEEREGKKER